MLHRLVRNRNPETYTEDIKASTGDSPLGAKDHTHMPVPSLFIPGHNILVPVYDHLCHLSVEMNVRVACSGGPVWDKGFPTAGWPSTASSHKLVAPSSHITLKVLDLRAPTPLSIFRRRRSNVKATSHRASWSLNWLWGLKGAQISARPRRAEDLSPGPRLECSQGTWKGF